MKIAVFLLGIAVNAFALDCRIDFTSYTAAATTGIVPIQKIQAGDTLWSVMVTTSSPTTWNLDLQLFDSWASTWVASPLKNSVLIGTFTASAVRDYDFRLELSSGLSYRLNYPANNPGLFFRFCNDIKVREPKGSWE